MTRRAPRLTEESIEAKLRRTEMGVETRIRELRDAGELSGLPGEGRPLESDPDDGGSDGWAARHLVRTSGARPLWADLRREITERRTRIVARLRSHQAWLDRRKALLEHAAAERIVAEIELTTEADRRVRVEVGRSIAELNALVRHHNLVVTTTSLHLPIATLEGLIEIARASRG